MMSRSTHHRAYLPVIAGLLKRERYCRAAAGLLPAFIPSVIVPSFLVVDVYGWGCAGKNDSELAMSSVITAYRVAKWSCKENNGSHSCCVLDCCCTPSSTWLPFRTRSGRGLGVLPMPSGLRFVFTRELGALALVCACVYSHHRCGDCSWAGVCLLWGDVGVALACAVPTGLISSCWNRL